MVELRMVVQDPDRQRLARPGTDLGDHLGGSARRWRGFPVYPSPLEQSAPDRVAGLLQS